MGTGESNGQATVAREYLRVSFDKSGRERSHDRQHDDNQRAADTEGWTLGEPYRDTGSASRYASKRRDDFDRLVADLEADRFKGDILVLWESSRGSRRLSEWSRFLELVEKRGVRIHVTSHGRTYDLTRPRDRRTLQEDGTDAEYESAKTRERIVSDMRASAVRGRPHGHLLFGYRRIYDPRTGEFERQEPDPDTAPIVRQIFTDYLAGHSLRTIQRGLNEQGVTTQLGAKWDYPNVRRLLSNRGYLGERVYWPKEARERGEPPEMTVKDAWPPIIDEDTFDRVQERLTSTFRGPRRQTPTARLLAGIVFCGADTGDGPCGAKLEVIVSKKTGVRYSCPRYHTSRRTPLLDTYVTAVILGRLARKDVDELLAESEDPKVIEARERAAELQAELDEAWELRRAKRLSLQRFADMEQELLPQIAEAERQVRRAAIPIDIDVPPPERLHEWWHDELTGEQRREYAAALLVSVTLLPPGRGRRNYDQADYTMIEWRR